MKRLLQFLTASAALGTLGCNDVPSEPPLQNSWHVPGFAKQSVSGHKRTLFVSGRSGSYDIYVMAPDGSGEKNVTATPGVEEFHPSLSRDNEWVAFAANDDLFRMMVNGGKLTQLTNTIAYERSPAWSPDGSQIAYASSELFPAQNAEIWVMDADGSNPHRITNFSAAAEHPTWSPGGKQIAFSSGGYVYTVPATCSLCTSGTQIGLGGSDPAWAPDNSYIVYTDQRPGSSVLQLYAYNVATGLEMPVSGAHDDTEPAWSSDATKLYFTRREVSWGSQQVWVFDYFQGMFYNPRQLQATGLVDKRPSGGGS
jgi:Tol biopolymer transport system component